MMMKLEWLININIWKYELVAVGPLQPLKKHIAEQGNKAVFPLIKKVRNLSWPIDIQIDLFRKKKL